MVLLLYLRLGPLGLNFLFFSTKRKFNKEKYDSRGDPPLRIPPFHLAGREFLTEARRWGAQVQGGLSHGGPGAVWRGVSHGDTCLKLRLWQGGQKIKKILVRRRRAWCARAGPSVPLPPFCCRSPCCDHRKSRIFSWISMVRMR